MLSPRICSAHPPPLPTHEPASARSSTAQAQSGRSARRCCTRSRHDILCESLSFSMSNVLASVCQITLSLSLFKEPPQISTACDANASQPLARVLRTTYGAFPVCGCTFTSPPRAFTLCSCSNLRKLFSTHGLSLVFGNTEDAPALSVRCVAEEGANQRLLQRHLGQEGPPDGHVARQVAPRGGVQELIQRVQEAVGALRGGRSGVHETQIVPHLHVPSQYCSMLGISRSNRNYLT